MGVGGHSLESQSQGDNDLLFLFLFTPGGDGEAQTVCLAFVVRSLCPGPADTACLEEDTPEELVSLDCFVTMEAGLPRHIYSSPCFLSALTQFLFIKNLPRARNDSISSS